MNLYVRLCEKEYVEFKVRRGYHHTDMVLNPTMDLGTLSVLVLYVFLSLHDNENYTNLLYHLDSIHYLKKKNEMPY